MTDDDFIRALDRNSQRLFLIALSFTKSGCDSEDIIQNVFIKLTRVELNTVFQGIFSPILRRKSSQCVSIACGFLLVLTKIYP